ncbi:MAG: ABC transporter substrate-binding protein [Bacteroidaceae bacterium]|nr:ABC transporter substrate-binding protein [Bacteroidaceae bacterium]
MRQLLSILILFMLASCNQQGAMLSSDEQAADSLVLRVATLPVEDCLPVYYAQRMGLFDSCGVRVNIQEYQSQMDCDTALVRLHSDIGYTCLPRIYVLQSQGDTLLPQFYTSGRMYLVSAKTKRLKKTKLLQDRIIGIERNSTADYFADQIITSAGLKTSDIYRAQINDVQLRTSMLNGQLVDAALLPEPYATLAECEGNYRLVSIPDSTLHFCCWAISSKTSRKKTLGQRIEQFASAYRKAANAICTGHCNKDTLNAILRAHYGLPQMVIDTLKIQVGVLPSPKEDSQRQAIKSWLDARKITHD